MTDCCEEPCGGGTLDRLIQPAILAVLASSDGLHGYELDRQLTDQPMMRGRKPDLAGVYRLLKRMEQRGLVVGDWALSDPGPAKRVYQITDNGLGCLGRWVRTLGEYCEALDAFIRQARAALRDSPRGCCGANADPSPRAASAPSPGTALPGISREGPSGAPNT